MFLPLKAEPIIPFFLPRVPNIRISMISSSRFRHSILSAGRGLIVNFLMKSAGHVFPRCSSNLHRFWGKSSLLRERISRYRSSWASKWPPDSSSKSRSYLSVAAPRQQLFNIHPEAAHHPPSLGQVSTKEAQEHRKIRAYLRVYRVYIHLI